MKRYKELKYDGKIYTEQYKIDEILIEKNFNWFLNCEIENVRIEIEYETLIFNSGVFFNGTWVYGVFRDGEWKNGVWENGVWYNGIWRRGDFNSGLIFNGKFFNGNIINGIIRGGNFYDIKINKDVLREDKYKPEKDKIQPVNPEPIIENYKIWLKNFESIKKDDIYILIEYIEKKSEKLKSENNEFDNNYINYYIINDNELKLVLGWISPEEYMRLESIIKFEKDEITLKGEQKGNSVYSDTDYKNEYNYSFNDIREIIEFINSEI